MNIWKFKFLVLLTGGVLLSNNARAQNLDDLRSYSVSQEYEKIDLDRGTLDDNGNPIDYILVESSIESGTYEINITDGPGSLYKIRGTDFYLDFTGYFGYAGYRTECIMEVSGNYYSSITVYKLN